MKKDDTITMLRAVVEEALEALASYCNTGYIDGADDLLAELLFERDHPPSVERHNVDPCKDGSCDCCWTDKPHPQGEQEPMAYYVERNAPGMRDNGMKLGPFWKREDADGWIDEHHQLRALYTRPKPSEPAYLLRDLAADIGVNAMDLIAAIRDASLGNYSINMKLPTMVVVAMCQKFAVAPPRQPLTEEQIDTLEWSVPQPGEDGAYLAQRRNVRAVERAHSIGGNA